MVFIFAKHLKLLCNLPPLAKAGIKNKNRSHMPVGERALRILSQRATG